MAHQVLLNRRNFIMGAAALGASPMSVARATATTNVMHLPFPMRGQIRTGAQATVTRIQTEKPHLALTFDDGPDGRHTPRLLDILAEHKAKATFYAER